MFGLWKWELASVLASVCLFAAMAVLLVRHNGQLQRDWSFPLSPNSLVAVFSTVIRVVILVPVAEGNNPPHTPQLPCPCSQAHSRALFQVLGQLKWSWFRRERPLSHLGVFEKASHSNWGSIQLLFLSRKPFVPFLCGRGTATDPGSDISSPCSVPSSPSCRWPSAP